MQGYIELQITTTSLASIIVEQLRGAGITVLDEFDHEGERYLIDHIEFGRTELVPAHDLTSARVALSAPRPLSLPGSETIPNIRGVMLQQSVTFFITTETALAAAGPAPQRTWVGEVVPGAGVTVPVLIALSVTPAGFRALLNARIVDIVLPQSQIDSLPADIRGLVTDLRRRLFPGPGIPGPLDSLAPSSIPLDLSAIGALIGQPVPIVNAGLRLDDLAGEPRVTMRFELDDFNRAATEERLEFERRIRNERYRTSEYYRLRALGEARRAMWTSFYGIASIDRLRGAAGARREWAVVVSSSLMTGVALEQIGAAVTATSAFRSSPHHTPSVSWSSTGGLAGLAIHIEGAVRDACTCAWNRVDINTGVDLTFTFGMPRRDVLALDVHLDWYTDFFGTACCILTAALVWPALGAVELGGGRIDGWAYVGGLATGPVGVLIGGIAAAATAGPEDRLALSAGAISLARRDDHNLHGEVTLTGRLHFDRFPSLAATAVEGHPDGLVVAGEFGEIRSAPLAALHCEEPHPFAWTVRETCQSAYVADVGTFGITNPGERLLHLQQVSLRGDRTHLYDGAVRWRLDQVPPSVIWPRGGRRDITLLLTPNRFRDRDPASIEPARILVRTDRGARLLSVPGAAPIGEEEAANMLLLSEQACGFSRGVFFGDGPGKGRFRIDYPLWDPDPDFQWRLLLAFSGHGFAERERVAILDREGRELAAVITTIEGALRLSTLAENKALHGAEIARTGLAKGEPLKAAPYSGGYKGRPVVTEQELIVRAVALAVRGEVKAAGKLVDHQLAHWGGRDVLLVTGTDGLRAVRVDSAGFGELVAEVEATGLRGAVALGENLYAFGDGGFAMITPDGRLAKLEEKPVKDAIVRNGVLLMLTDSGLVGWNGTGFDSVPTEGLQVKGEFHRLAMVAGILVAYGPGGLLRLGAKQTEHDVLELPVERLRALLTDPGRVLARVDGRDAVIDVKDEQALRVVVELDTELGESWQARAVGAVGVIALASEDGATIELLSPHAVVETESLKSAVN